MNAASHSLTRPVTDEEHRLAKANRSLAEQRNEAEQDVRDLRESLAEYGSVISVLVARLGGDEYITRAQLSELRLSMLVCSTKRGVRIQLQRKDDLR